MYPEKSTNETSVAEKPYTRHFREPWSDENLPPIHSIEQVTRDIITDLDRGSMWIARMERLLIEVPEGFDTQTIDREFLALRKKHNERIVSFQKRVRLAFGAFVRGE